MRALSLGGRGELRRAWNAGGGVLLRDGYRDVHGTRLKGQECVQVVLAVEHHLSKT